MIKSREIALRCAASLPSNLLLRGWKRDEDGRNLHGLSDSTYRRGKSPLVHQLDACQSDGARRLILGRSK